MQEIERVLRQATRALDRQFEWRITARRKTECLLEARGCIGHRDSETSNADQARCNELA
jgi:hypothetical protein